MKILITTAAMLLSTAAFAHEVPSKSSIHYVGDTDYAGFCKAIVEDNVSMLKASLASKVGTIEHSRHRVLKRLVSEEGMSCNGESLIDFSNKKKATRVTQYLQSAS